MGEAAFGRKMAAYLKACPSTSPSLRYIGKQLPHYLAEQNKPLLADIAQLEWAVLKAFDAADASVSSADTLAQIPPEAWQNLHFKRHPSVSMLEVSAHAFAIWTAYRQQPPLPEKQTDETAPLLVWRSQHGPAVKILSSECHTLLSALDGRHSFAQVCEHLTAVLPHEDIAQSAARCLLELLNSHCLADINTSVENNAILSKH